MPLWQQHNLLSIEVMEQLLVRNIICSTLFSLGARDMLFISFIREVVACGAVISITAVKP